MKKVRLFKTLFAASLALATVILTAWQNDPDAEPTPRKYGPETGLAEVLLALGDAKPLHYTAKRDTALIRMGRDIVTKGRTLGPDGKMSTLQSKYFKCTHCHNQAIEDPDLRYSNPDTRLDYVVKNKMPFLQGTTFYGMVNRESWYNEDYFKKYGQLVADARDTLENAIHLCSVECSQGRLLKAWELEAVMVYLYSIQYRLGDFNMNEEQYKMLDDMLTNGANDNQKKDAIRWLKQQYFTASPATFLYPLPVNERSDGSGGNAARGQLIYQHGCQHCHSPGNVTNFVLDNSELTFGMLERHLNKHTHYSTYEIVRKGTYALPGYRPYMPLYTQERMSKQQLTDLVAFINQQASK